MMDEEGEAIWLGANPPITPAKCEAAVTQSARRAHEQLPPGRIFEIRATSSRFKRDVGVAWYSSGAIQEKPMFDRLPFPGTYDEHLGANIIARLRAGEANGQQ